jgi:hypothetical protein
MSPAGSIAVGALCACLVTACGPDTLTASTTAARSAAAANKQAQDQKAAMEAKIKAAQEAEQKRAAVIDEQAEKAPSY